MSIVQEEKEARPVEGGEGPERHHLLQQLRGQRAEGQGEEGNHQAEPRGTHSGEGAPGRWGIYRISHHNSLLLHFMQCTLWHCESQGKERKKVLVTTKDKHLVWPVSDISLYPIMLI